MSTVIRLLVKVSADQGLPGVTAKWHCEIDLVQKREALDEGGILVAEDIQDDGRKLRAHL